MTDFNTELDKLQPHLELDEIAENFAKHLTRDELFIFIVALIEERDEQNFVLDLSEELEDMLENTYQ